MSMTIAILEHQLESVMRMQRIPIQITLTVVLSAIQKTGTQSYRPLAQESP